MRFCMVGGFGGPFAKFSRMTQKKRAPRKMRAATSKAKIEPQLSRRISQDPSLAYLILLRRARPLCLYIRHGTTQRDDCL
jgi:hypothetical protein